MVGKVSRKALRILALYGRKCGWVVEQDFMGIFGFFCPFFRSSPLNHAHSALV